ncbi:MAG: RNA polymerase sigma factor [Bacteroidales bacterium]|nr:RNA polymerase sigma factor [Bacteroidales bacterium]
MIPDKVFPVHQDLIERCIKKDRLAQKELYRLYYKAMYNTCYRMLNDKVEAEDVMQESFLAVFTKISTYRGEMSFGSWLKRIVINKSIDILRARKIRFEELNEKSVIMATPDDHDAGIEGEHAAMVEKIREAVKKLPDGFRVVLTLSLFEGFDHEEIAWILQISESTSRSQLARAKKKLIEYLKSSRNEDYR